MYLLVCREKLNVPHLLTHPNGGREFSVGKSQGQNWAMVRRGGTFDIINKG